MKQLETGRDLAHLMGGKERPDGVGQLALGLWFAEKLKGKMISYILTPRSLIIVELCLQSIIAGRAISRSMQRRRHIRSDIRGD